MPGPKKDTSGGGHGGRAQNGKVPHSPRAEPFTHSCYVPGHRSGFQTDTAISNSRFGNERVLQRWVPDSSDVIDGSLEKQSNKGGAWDQFAENERLFGVKTDYKEEYYTTALNKSHPQYQERYAHADKKAREIERSTAMTAHVAEERVADHVGGNDQSGENEEDK